MIKIISFDIGGTILFSKSIENYTLKKLTELVQKPHNEVRSAYKRIFQKEKGPLEELVSKFTSLLDIKVNEEILNFFREKFDENNNIVVFDENVISIVDTLKENGFKVILFSNSCCLLNNNFSDDFIKKLDGIFYSYDIGYTKDEKDSYKIIEKNMDVEPYEILHIGDTLKSDYFKPIENGWNAVYYGNSDDETIRSIDDLNNLEIILGDLWGMHLTKKRKDLKKL